MKARAAVLLFWFVSLHLVNTVTMTTQQTVWPSFPLTLSQVEGVPWPVYLTQNYKGVVVSSRPPVPYYNRFIEYHDCRKFLLRRSVFDLVGAHSWLALTNPILQRWCLCLSPEDGMIIRDEGGFHLFLQGHPALEVSGHHVYVKYSCGYDTARPTITSNNYTSRATPAKSDNEMTRTYLQYEGLVSNLQENSPLLGDKRSKKHSHKEIRQEGCFQPAYPSSITEEPRHQRQEHKGSLLTPRMEETPSMNMYSAAACPDPAVLASYSLLDMELDRCRQRRQPELCRETPTTQGNSSNVSYAGMSQLQSDWLRPIKQPQSEYCSLSSEDTMGDDQANLSFGNGSHSFHCLQEEDESIISLARVGQEAPTSGVQAGPVTTDREEPLPCSEALNVAQSNIKTSSAGAYTSSLTPVPTCDVMVGTEPTECVSAVTQTKGPATADKNILTEVRMDDLDFLTEAFIKLKAAQELRGQKETNKRLRHECDCVHRAQQAEVQVLAVQYNMCRQHCWRLHYTSAEAAPLSPVIGDMSQNWSKDPLENIFSVLQKLESDYNHMRDKILAGVPLEHLKPLSVDSEEIKSGTSYIPIIGDEPSWSPPQTQNVNNPGEGNGRSDEQHNKANQDDQSSKNLVNQLEENCSKSMRAVTFVPQEREAICYSDLPQGKQTSAFKELNTSEVWFDAEEDFHPAAPAAEMREQSPESDGEETVSSGLRVSNLPSNVTESDVMLWFEKYQASEVTVSTLKKDVSVAIVMVSSRQSAEGAVTDLNGCSMQGRTLRVEHINRASAGSQAPTAKTVSDTTGGGVMTRPPLSSSTENRQAVFITPTPNGTCVPQHYGTMDGFDTLMVELTQLHPDVGRQRIVEALIELRAKHQGNLISLPLRTIGQMTSDLLTGSVNATRI